MASQQLYKTPVGGFKKRRLQNSCDNCKQKKIRCDSADQASNICTHCISFNLECTHRMAEARVAKRVGKQAEEQATIQPTRSSSASAQPPQLPLSLGGSEIDDAKAHISAILSTSTPYRLVEDQAVTLKILVQISCYARYLEGQVDHKYTPSAASSPRQPSNSPEPENLPRPVPFSSDLPRPKEAEADRDIPLSEPLRQLHFGLTDAKDAFYGKGSNVMLLKTAFNIKGQNSGTELNGHSSKRPEYWTRYTWQQPLTNNEPLPLEFPDVDLMFHLVALYFDKFQLSIRMLHRPSFERNVYEGLHLRDRSFGALLLTVCALGSRYSADPRVLIDGCGELSAGWQWINRLRPFEILSFGVGVETSVIELQTMCNYILFIQPTTTDLTWPLIGLGFRYAQVAGAHRKHFMQHKPLAEQELWKRAFWVLIALDTYSSAFYGRPRCTTPIDYNQEFPLEVDDEYWEHSDPEQCFKQPPDKPSTITFWVQFLKILRVLGIAQRSYLGLNKRGLESHIWGIPEDHRVLTELDSLLNVWIDQVPEHLRWKPDQPDSVFFNQSATIHSIYYWVQIQVHRPFIAVPGCDDKSPNLSYSTLAVCSNAARSCIRLLDIQSKKGTVDWTTSQVVTVVILLPSVLAVSSFGQMSLYSSAMVFMLNLWGNSRPGLSIDPTRHLQDVHRCISVLKCFEPRWQKAGGLIDIITEILTMTELPSNPYITSKKRSRTDDGDGEGSQTPLQQESSPQYPPFSDDWWLNAGLGSSTSGDTSASHPGYVELPLYTEDLSGSYFDPLPSNPNQATQTIAQDFGAGLQQGQQAEVDMANSGTWVGGDPVFTDQSLPPFDGNTADLWFQAIGGDPWVGWTRYFGVDGYQI